MLGSKDRLSAPWITTGTGEVNSRWTKWTRWTLVSTTVHSKAGDWYWRTGAQERCAVRGAYKVDA